MLFGHGDNCQRHYQSVCVHRQYPKRCIPWQPNIFFVYAQISSISKIDLVQSYIICLGCRINRWIKMVGKKFLTVRVIAAILLLPVNVMFLIPALFFDLSVPILYHWTTWVSIAIGVPATILSIKCLRLFIQNGGGGTPAPWDPVQNLIIKGPYRYVRNPMLIGVIFFLFSESLFFLSIPLFIYATLFLLGNMVYFPLVEEKGLIKRYGGAYLTYMSNVPKWLPRSKPYNPE